MPEHVDGTRHLAAHEGATVVISFPGAFHLLDAKISVFLDSQPVGRGSVVRGLNLRFNAPLGRHTLEVRYSFRRLRETLELDRPGTYDVALSYNRMWGRLEYRVSYRDLSASADASPPAPTVAPVPVGPEAGQGVGCPRCGHSNAAAATHCDRCGASLRAEEPIAVAQGEPAAPQPAITAPAVSGADLRQCALAKGYTRLEINKPPFPLKTPSICVACGAPVGEGGQAAARQQELVASIERGVSWRGPGMERRSLNLKATVSTCASCASLGLRPAQFIRMVPAAMRPVHHFRWLVIEIGNPAVAEIYRATLDAQREQLCRHISRRIQEAATSKSQAEALEEWEAEWIALEGVRAAAEELDPDHEETDEPLGMVSAKRVGPGDRDWQRPDPSGCAPAVTLLAIVILAAFGAVGPLVALAGGQ
jgi:hypothetical protein